MATQTWTPYPWPGPVIPTWEQIEAAAALLGITAQALYQRLFGTPPPPPPPPPNPGPVAEGVAAAAACPPPANVPDLYEHVDHWWRCVTSADGRTVERVDVTRKAVYWPRRILGVLAVLLTCAVAQAQKVALPPEVKGEPGGLVIVAAETDCAALQWLVLDPGLNLIPGDLLKDTRKAVGVAPRPGVYRLLAYGAKGDQASAPAVCRVVVGTPAPDPGPGPGPGPGPQPNPTGDVRVLLVYDVQAPLSREQQGALFDPAVAAYLDRVCVKDGPQASWRLWDVHVEATDKEPAALRDLWSATRPALSATPAVVIAVGKAAKVHPLPPSGKDLVSLIARETGRQ